MAHYHPAEERDQSECNNAGNEIASYNISHTLDWGSACLRILNQLDDLTQLGVLASANYLHIYGTCTVHCPGVDKASSLLANRESFTSDHAFISIAFPTDDNTVSGNFVTGTEKDDVPNLNKLGRNELVSRTRGFGIA